MTTIQEMVDKLRERIESDPKFNERLAELKAKAEAEQKAKEEAKIQTQAKFAEMIAKAQAKIEAAKAESDAT